MTDFSDKVEKTIAQDEATIGAVELNAVSGITEISRSDDILRAKAGMSRLYSIVVIIVIVFSISR